MRPIFLSILIITSLITPVMAQLSFPFTGQTTADRLNIRAGQSTNFESLGKLAEGEQVVIEAEEYGWYQIRLPKQAKVFISAQYVLMLDANIGEVIGDRVNVRAGADDYFTAVGQVEKGDRLRVVKQGEKWHQIEPLPTMRGWVGQEFVSFKSTSAPKLAKAVFNVVKEEVKEKQKEVSFSVGDLVSLKGTLSMVVGQCAQVSTFQLSQDKDVIYVKGPNMIFKSFNNAAVNIYGKVNQPSTLEGCQHPIISVSSVNLAL